MVRSEGSALIFRGAADLQACSGWYVCAATKPYCVGENNSATGQGGNAWWTLMTHMNWQTDNKWPDSNMPPFGYPIWMRAGDIVRVVPRVMENHKHWAMMAGALLRAGKIGARFAAVIFRMIPKDAWQMLAEHINGGPLQSDGARMLDQAYNLGQEITSRLVGGGR